MIPLTESDIRSAFVNASLRERKAITIPELDSVRWDELDYFGWRDPKVPAIGYIVAHVDGSPVGIMLRDSGDRPLARAQCAWCEDVHLPNDVVLVSVKRAGAAGRNGDTVATLLCSRFECSANVRRLAPPAYLGFDAEAERVRRIGVLRDHVARFLGDIASGR